MQLSSQDRAKFYRRITVSVGLFALLMSLGANVFFMVTRHVARSPDLGSSVPRYEEEPLLKIPEAYGTVQRGFAKVTVKASGTSSLLPVGSYVLDDALLPVLPDNFPLFRDQGVPLYEEQVQRVFDRLGVTIDWQELALLPSLERFRTADRTMDITLDIERRALTISRTGSFSPSDEGPADDAAVVALARAFAASLGIDTVPYGDPHIVERTTEQGGPQKTYVVWAMSFNGLPLLDANADTVPALQVHVGRLSRQALSMTVTLLRHDRMAKSSYPAASSGAVTESLRAGGMLPHAKDLKGKKTNVVFTSVTPAYVLLLGDREFPTYIVPVYVGRYKQGSVFGTTFVPALSPEKFLWHPQEKRVTSATGSSAL